MKYLNLLAFNLLFLVAAAQSAMAVPAYMYDANGNPIGSTAGALNVTSSASVNTNGSSTTSTVVGSGATVTLAAPANAVGFILEASSSNSVNLRWAVGSTPTTSAGMRLEPGRDSGYVPIAKDVKVIAESGSNMEAEIQWVLSQ